MIKNIIFDGNGIIYKHTIDGDGHKKRTLKKRGVRKKLKELKNYYSLYILTDGVAKIETKIRALKRMRVYKYFKKIIATYQLRMSKKKNYKVFIKAMEIWEINAKNTVFIGHDKREIKNAKKSGLTTIQTHDITKLTEL
ncbi:hypothetical protein COX58_03580 [archaeon CG_4_10_14_0_2_um_filter_Archaea_38_6]|nr:MAG: hypothetical protein COS83_04825 [archaeon CG07_land_8_20_14_0_80_38_8]PIU89588.1 MAG: hypothetical protein COS64_00685 [archaeon CG06_land_8_20_14_3_00_37_11]PJA21689.1 MAG: hypothetical protein COX58_03580 [archaeon CG_4_10_14_0_2_um_filter_Archaea_38_6]